MKRYWTVPIGLIATLALALALAGCGGGGGGGGAANLDRDGDGIPNAEDAFPDDPTRFAAFTPVDLPGLQGTTFSSAMAINDNGVIVGIANDVQGDVHPVVWTMTAGVSSAAGHLETPAPPAGVLEFAAAHGVNDAGDAVGEANNASGGRDAIFWLGTLGTPLAASPTVLPAVPGAVFSAAYGVNNTRRVVGESQSSGVTKAVTWTVAVAAGVPSASQPDLLGEPAGGTASSAYFISQDNRIVGEYTTTAGTTVGLLWTPGAAAGTFTTLDLPPLVGDAESVAYGINDGGMIVGESTSAEGLVTGVTWTLAVAGTPPATVATAVPLGTPGEGNALAVNDLGRLAGWTMAAGGNEIATVWDARNLDLADAFLAPTLFSMGFGTNNAGTIVGMAGDQAFAAVPQ